MRHSLYFAALSLLLTACTDQGGGLLSPGTPSRTLSSTGMEVYVLGQTFGPHGEFWQSSGPQTHCGTAWVTITWQGKGTYVGLDKYCQPTALSGSTIQSYNGGVIQIFVQQDGGYTSLGTVPADLSKDGRSIDVPAGAAVKLQAVANTGCSFSSWELPDGAELTNPLILPANAGAFYDITGNFVCR